MKLTMVKTTDPWVGSPPVRGAWIEIAFPLLERRARASRPP